MKITTITDGVSWAKALAEVDEALTELARLRREVARLAAERDSWRIRASYHR